MKLRDYQSIQYLVSRYDQEFLDNLIFKFSFLIIGAEERVGDSTESMGELLNDLQMFRKLLDYDLSEDS